MAIKGYARVSTDGQTLEKSTPSSSGGRGNHCLQKLSGAVTGRKALAKAIGQLEPGMFFS